MTRRGGVIQAGGRDDEYAVEAGALDQSYIGLAFGYNVADRTLYGTLGGVEVSTSHVTLWLADVPEEWSTLRLAPSDTLYFSRCRSRAHEEAQLRQMETQLEGGGTARR
jgi:hypothetical protein